MKSEANFKRKTWKQRQLLSESGFVLCTAPPSLSRDRGIQNNKKSSNRQAEQWSLALASRPHLGGDEEGSNPPQIIFISLN